MTTREEMPEVTEQKEALRWYQEEFWPAYGQKKHWGELPPQILPMSWWKAPDGLEFRRYLESDGTCPICLFENWRHQELCPYIHYNTMNFPEWINSESGRFPLEDGGAFVAAEKKIIECMMSDVALERTEQEMRKLEAEGYELFPHFVEEGHWNEMNDEQLHTTHDFDVVSDQESDLSEKDGEMWIESWRQVLNPPAQSKIYAGDCPDALSEQVGGDHYKKFTIQPIEFIQRNGLSFCEGNVVKYICRHKNKGQLEDLKKVIHYARLEAELTYGVEL